MAALIISIYITITLVSLFTFAGPYSPLVGLAVGIPIHILIVLTQIYKEIKVISKNYSNSFCRLYVLFIRYKKKRKEWGSLGINIGDLVYQLIMFILLLGMIFAVYFFVRSLLARLDKPNNIEQKT
ncbi:DUF4083 family protein [[Brevibacterium] frigoritolerans]|uniref:DUF4083 family protein n=1 Tax=Peribacillus frigoritolerans TaxID=450367 RepID=A0A941J7N8_9BACI|nr:DUF4083 family protein [Peribacillus frigoritolerans]